MTDRHNAAGKRNAAIDLDMLCLELGVDVVLLLVFGAHS